MGVFIREAIENELRYREGQKRKRKARGGLIASLAR
jgi:hypothetical protein